MSQEQKHLENQACAAQNGVETAALDLRAPADAQALPEAANNNDDQAEDPAEIYFAHG